MKQDPAWISKPVALALHERLLAEHGGVPGLLDEGLLDAALAAPRNRRAYGRADAFRLAAAYANALTRNRPFSDGNKRVAFTVAGVFLEINGFRLEAPEAEAVAAVLALTERKLDEAQFAAWLRASSSAASRRRRRRP
jgi:death-on-curing protein